MVFVPPRPNFWHFAFRNPCHLVHKSSWIWLVFSHHLLIYMKDQVDLFLGQWWAFSSHVLIKNDAELFGKQRKLECNFQEIFFPFFRFSRNDIFCEINNGSHCVGVDDLEILGGSCARVGGAQTCTLVSIVAQLTALCAFTLAWNTPTKIILVNPKTYLVQICSTTKVRHLLWDWNELRPFWDCVLLWCSCTEPQLKFWNQVCFLLQNAGHYGVWCQWQVVTSLFEKFLFFLRKHRFESCIR